MNITYLFGAGASKNAIPINKELTASMHDELLLLEKEFDANVDGICDASVNPFVNKEIFRKLLIDYKSIVTESTGHQSIDTFAKKLYIRGDRIKLKKLKTILSIYFIIIQSKRQTDKRYDSFFASILEESHNIFPKNLKIVSWNYDYQFEKAYSEYSMDDGIDASTSILHIYSKNSRLSYIDYENFGIIKLNGTASFCFNTKDNNLHYFFKNVNQTYNSDLVQNLIANYYDLLHNDKQKEYLVPAISFAWEEYNFEKPIIQKTMDFVAKTEILVVVGYSFPFFNRKADRDIIGAMSNLSKVYFQAPDAEHLRERFLAIKNDLHPDNLLLRTDVDQFVFPNEF